MARLKDNSLKDYFTLIGNYLTYGMVLCLMILTYL